MSPLSPDSSRIIDALRDPLSGLGLDLEAVELTPAGKKRVLRVAVDKDGGVTLDDIAEATRAVSRELDDGDLMGEQAYTLEVTSRGVDRPLTEPRHWRRNHDRLVRAGLTDGTQVTGRVGESDDDGRDPRRLGGAAATRVRRDHQGAGAGRVQPTHSPRRDTTDGHRPDDPAHARA